MPRITITRRQGEPVYGALRRLLTTIDDIRVFADDEPEEAGRLALQFADDFRLFEDVGWDPEDPRDSIRLTMPPTDLRRVLVRLQAEAEGASATAAEEEREESEVRAETRRRASRPARPAASFSTTSAPSSKAGARPPALDQNNQNGGDPPR